MTAPLAEISAPAGGPTPGGESLWRLAWRRFRRNPAAMSALAVLMVLAVLSLLAPHIAPHPRDTTNLLAIEQAPSAAHWLGTDDLGRDVLTRLLWGGRISLSVGLVAVGIAISIGTLLGALSGYYGGVIDNLIMRATDVVMVFPFLPLALTITAVLGPSIWNTMAAIGLLSWTGVARLVRAEFLSLRQREFIEAARALGVPDGRIITRHLLPGAMAPLLVAATLGVAGAILGEAGLSFLGLGVPQPVPSWGNMLASATSMKVLLYQPWLWVPPGATIFLAVLAINFVGDGLRDALDPRMKDS